MNESPDFIFAGGGESLISGILQPTLAEGKEISDLSAKVSENSRMLEIGAAMKRASQVLGMKAFVIGVRQSLLEETLVEALGRAAHMQT